MLLKELLKLLVETPDQMERMSLIEANQDVVAPQPEPIKDEGGEWETKYNELKTKYVETFFSGTKEKEKELIKTKEEVAQEAETLRGETITADELIKEGILNV